jgi:Xaa-Pro aminopeptidase
MATEVRPHGPALRLGRRERALAQMKAHDLDVLVLGRTANVRYVTGATTLWLAGTSSFGPACMLVRSTGSIHMLSTWDEGIPEDIPRENLFGLTWNPMNTIEVLRRVEGTAGALRVGTDTMSPSFARLLPAAFPAAELVDGEVAMRAARRIKTAEELDVLRQAAEVAGISLAKAVAELRPGVTGKELSGVLLEAAAAGGVTTPAVQDAVCVTSKDHPWRRAGGDGRAAPGDLVAFTSGVVAHGYIAEVGRTYAVASAEGVGAIPEALSARCDHVWERLLAACRPGAPASALLESYAGAGEPLPPMPVARGLGLGWDPPVVTGALPRTARDERIEQGMVLALTGYVWEAGIGAAFRRDSVLVTDNGPELLTTAPVG